LQKISEERATYQRMLNPTAQMNIDLGLILLESVTLAVVVFGALAVFIARRWFSPSNDEPPPGLWLRFTVLLFGFCLIALIEGLLLHSFGFFWFVLVAGITLLVIAKIAPKLLGNV
jgi:O-antigen ligase